MGLGHEAGWPIRALDPVPGVQVARVIAAWAGLRRSAVMQDLAWMMVCWGAYAHAASFEGRMRPSKSRVSGGDLAMAFSGSRRIMPPQWAQTLGASAAAG